jgi:hypothetical protein
MISILSMTLLMEVLSHEISRVSRNMDIWGIGEIPLIPRLLSYPASMVGKPDRRRALLPEWGEGELEHKSDLTTRMRRKCQRILLGKH